MTTPTGLDVSMAKARLARFDSIVTRITQLIEIINTPQRYGVGPSVKDANEELEAQQAELPDLAHELAGSLDQAMTAVTVLQSKLAARTLSVRDVVALGTIVEATKDGDRVRWLTDSGHVQDGVARGITHQGGGFLSSTDDVREGFLWVSGMFEHWLPIADVLRLMENGELSFT